MVLEDQIAGRVVQTEVLEDPADGWEVSRQPYSVTFTLEMGSLKQEKKIDQSLEILLLFPTHNKIISKVVHYPQSNTVLIPIPLQSHQPLIAPYLPPPTPPGPDQPPYEDQHTRTVARASKLFTSFHVSPVSCGLAQPAAPPSRGRGSWAGPG